MATNNAESPLPQRIAALLVEMESLLTMFPAEAQRVWTRENPDTRLHAVLRDLVEALRASVAAVLTERQEPETLDFTKIADSIVRNHETFCKGHSEPDAPFCSTLLPSEPMCDSCSRLRLLIAQSLRRAVLSDRREPQEPKPFGASVEELEQAFRGGYHCQWIKDDRRYIFDPAMSPGDPDGAFRAWLMEYTGTIAVEPQETPQPIRAHRLFCGHALSIPVDLCPCGGRDFTPNQSAASREPQPEKESMASPTSAYPYQEPVRCPQCFRSDNVSPLRSGDYECSACARAFTWKQRYGAK